MVLKRLLSFVSEIRLPVTSDEGFFFDYSVVFSFPLSWDSPKCPISHVSSDAVFFGELPLLRYGSTLTAGFSVLSAY